MEHIVQFGINIDDEAIKMAIESSVMKQVANEIKTDCMRRLTGRENATHYDYSQKLKDMVNDNIQEFFNNNKTAIIEVASDKLADKLSKTKVVRDAICNSIEKFI